MADESLATTVSTRVASCLRSDGVALVPITALSSLYFILSSSPMHRAWPWSSQTDVLSLLFPFNLLPSFHVSHTSILHPHFFSPSSNIFTSLIIIFLQPSRFFSITLPGSLQVFMFPSCHPHLSCSLLSSFPLLFFSLSDNDTGKFTPLQL